MLLFLIVTCTDLSALLKSLLDRLIQNPHVYLCVVFTMEHLSCIFTISYALYNVLTQTLGENGVYEIQDSTSCISPSCDSSWLG